MPKLVVSVATLLVASVAAAVCAADARPAASNAEDGCSAAVPSPEMSPVANATAPERPATVVTAEFHGHGFMCGGTGVKGAELWFRAPHRPKAGEKVNLAFDPNKTLVFASNDEREP